MPQINIALDSLSFIIMLILFIACLEERINKEIKSNSYLLTFSAIMIALVADALSWIGEGNPAMATLTIVANVVAACAGYMATFFFILYLWEEHFRDNKAVDATVFVLGILCVAATVMLIVNTCNQSAFLIDEHGHYVCDLGTSAMFWYLQFPVISLLTTALMMFCAKSVSLRERLYYVSYLLFPTVGLILDYMIHGISLTYVGMTVSAVIIFAHLHMKKRKLISEQRTALAVSQINPHFMYNTLTTIASLCDIDPREAKELTVEFSSFLRQNLDTLNNSEVIPFEQELRHVGCYLKIEKARFKDRVNVIYSISTKDFGIPPLTVQPLVENAIKHGITKKQSGGTVKISTFRKDNCNVIEIIDDGVGFDFAKKLSDKKSHIGINNVRARLKDMCGGTLEIKSMEGVGTRATITVPDKKGRRK